MWKYLEKRGSAEAESAMFHLQARANTFLLNGFELVSCILACKKYFIGKGKGLK